MADIEAPLNEFKDRILGREVGSEATADDYLRWIQRFETWHDGGPVDEATLRDFDSYLCYGEEGEAGFPWTFTRPLENSDRDEAYAYRTRVKAISALLLWFRLHYDVDVRTNVQNIVLGEEPDFDPHYLSRDEVQAIIAGAAECDNDGCQAALALAYDAILRSAELTRVRRDDLDLDAGTIYVRAAKGSQNATLGLSQSTVERLRRHISAHPDREHPFHNAYDRKWRPKAFSKHFHRTHHGVGIHSFSRHSPIVHRLEYPEEFSETMNPDDPFGEVYRRARHVHPNMTARYARLVGMDVPDWSNE
jgi:integrase